MPGRKFAFMYRVFLAMSFINTVRRSIRYAIEDIKHAWDMTMREPE